MSMHETSEILTDHELDIVSASGDNCRSTWTVWDFVFCAVIVKTTTCVDQVTIQAS